MSEGSADSQLPLRSSRSQWRARRYRDAVAVDDRRDRADWLPASNVLLCFGLSYIATGLIYRPPIPVQPMKAIAAIALVSEITPGAIVLSGVLIGLVPLALGASGLIDKLARLVPQSVLSGLQLGLGMALGWIALGLMTDHVGVGIVSLGVAVAALRFGAGLLVLALVPDPLRQIVLMSIPMTTLGALLLIASVELAASQRLIDARPSCRPVMAVTALGTVLGTPLTGLILGTLAEIVRKRILRHATNAFR